METPLPNTESSRFWQENQGRWSPGCVFAILRGGPNMIVTKNPHLSFSLEAIFTEEQWAVFGRSVGLKVRNPTLRLIHPNVALPDMTCRP
ncbi:hypothetical protein GDO81_021802 [Engystomops pustulosus]|uniref:Uncharacterized protein n=1 Tax=Engystomops pustulosus TaxID=76066 RepID=A0AAV6ZP40_ENGPU|nr:hypothetical protein GDO81_021802 [Engystomops pustulosus]